MGVRGRVRQLGRQCQFIKLKLHPSCSSAKNDMTMTIGASNLHLNPSNLRLEGWTRETPVVVGSVQHGQPVHPFWHDLILNVVTALSTNESSAWGWFFSFNYNLGWTGWTGWTGTEKSGTSCVQPPDPRVDHGEIRLDHAHVHPAQCGPSSASSLQRSQGRTV